MTFLTSVSSIHINMLDKISNLLLITRSKKLNYQNTLLKNSPLPQKKNEFPFPSTVTPMNVLSFHNKDHTIMSLVNKPSTSLKHKHIAITTCYQEADCAADSIPSKKFVSLSIKNIEEKISKIY
jgi:hypothetical protein